MLTLRMEPAVVDGLDIASLFETGELLVDEVDDFMVVANDAQLTSREVNFVEGNVVDVQFLDFTFQRQLAPDEVLLLAAADVAEGSLGRRENLGERLFTHSP